MTGTSFLIGFFIFVSFLFSLLADSLLSLGSSKPYLRYLGIAGLFSWLAVLMYNLTQDSFATPNLWINFGILAGVTTYAFETRRSIPAPSTAPGEGSLSAEEMR